ncbi:hypothetical protein MKEN_00544100 [Mycena kentingensis (nom. inval.)]|nr:hypothetical protein MKEN_00544100 [Mycena kentingensis (nom. inval.)]
MLYNVTLRSPATTILRSVALRSRLASSASAAKHTADSYSKEVDSTPAKDPKVHRVDPASETVQKPYEPPSGPYSQTGVEAGVENAQGKKDSKKKA